MKPQSRRELIWKKVSYQVKNLDFLITKKIPNNQKGRQDLLERPKRLLFNLL